MGMHGHVIDSTTASADAVDASWDRAPCSVPMFFLPACPAPPRLPARLANNFAASPGLRS